MGAIYHDMIHDRIEDYVNHVVIKSKEVNQHINDLRRRVFLRDRKYNLKMNPLILWSFIWKISRNLLFITKGLMLI